MNTNKALLAVATVLAVILFLPDAEAKKRGQCDENGKCKYGGWCDKSTNTCRCNFQCSASLWGKNLHCGLKRGGPRYFRNLCYVLAHACERQEDIPIIPMDFSQPKHLRCKDPKKTQLCPEVDDFLGRCGGGFGKSGNIGAGICLMDKAIKAKRCQCPNGRTGYECQAKTLHVRSVEIDHQLQALGGPEMSSPNGTTNNTMHIVVFVAVAALSICACVALFVRRHSAQKRKPHAHDSKTPEDYERAPEGEHELALSVVYEESKLRAESSSQNPASGGDFVADSRHEKCITITHQHLPFRSRLTGHSSSGKPRCEQPLSVHVESYAPHPNVDETHHDRTSVDVVV